MVTKQAAIPSIYGFPSQLRERSKTTDTGSCTTLQFHKPNYSAADSSTTSSFLHGGAWHDPDITSAFATSAVAKLHQSPLFNTIAGIASLNYRLSAHLNHPSSPSLPNDHARSAKHPEHLTDVVAGIAFLQRRFNFAERYVIVGHSCGATLAFQTIINSTPARNRTISANACDQLYAPKAIVGTAGLYDLVLLRDMDPAPPMCQEFLASAFGHNEEVWRAASPVSVDYKRLWEAGRVAVLTVCQEDQYVSVAQQCVMVKALERWANQGGRNLKMMTVNGCHDDIWRKGDGLVAGIEEAMSLLLD